MVCPQKESFRMLIKFRIANIEEFVFLIYHSKSFFHQKIYMDFHFHQENQTVQTNSHRWSLPSLLNNHLYF